MQFSSISEIGKRESMEDAHFLIMNPGGHEGWMYGGVYDGHLGSYASQYAAEHLHEIFLKKVERGQVALKAFINTYEEVSQALQKQNSGTVAVDFFLQDSKLTVANAGDARILVIRATSLEQLTIDHRILNPKERKRIIEAGGTIYDPSPYVWRGEAGLMPTRTLGDEYFKAIGVIATPEVREYAVAQDDIWLLAACDGIFDKMSNEAVATFLRKFDAPDMALKELKNEVLVRRGGTDNATAILLKLH